MAYVAEDDARQSARAGARREEARAIPKARASYDLSQYASEKRRGARQPR
jgi:hypothetical protein